MRNTRPLQALCLVLLLCCSLGGIAADSLDKAFTSPPASARPWVYWFWLDGNITREGITADLEAMKRVGIGGVLIMEVEQGTPTGPVGFMSPQWREMFKHVASEARRLGLEVNMNNDAGWNGSGGPWIKPEQSMQQVVSSEVDLSGPRHYEGLLAQPNTIAGYYKDIKVLAFPTPGPYRILDIQGKARYRTGEAAFSPSTDVTPENCIAQDRILDITDKMDSEGKLVWDVPEGKWTVMRFGHTSTGTVNLPAPASGRGLECDKLSKEGAEANFSNMIAKLAADVGDNLGKSFVATHVDSWENGAQNWTGLMREEFQKRRGYDLIPFLPVYTGRVVGSSEISERFLWDLRKTISEMVVENYAGEISRLAHERGLRFTIEAYGGPCDSVAYGGQADEPMGEFWNPGGAMQTCKAMVSAGHVYGRNIIGAEAFTSFADERWLAHPGSLKKLGDMAFCAGINRFVIHRYAMQPWEPSPKPGMMMGPWGVHYERTQTWWEETADWHRYLARCQHMLRQGLFAADVCFVQEHPWVADAWIPLEGHAAAPSHAYEWDQCSPEVTLTRMSVKDGRLVLPDGMNYRLLVLPNSRYMTPQMVRKVKELVTDGATIIGPKPHLSPSLSGYPECDAEVRRLAAELWGDCDGKLVTENKVGKGRIIWGQSPEVVLAKMGVGPDFTSSDDLNFIHRSVGNTDVYFVASSKSAAPTVTATFRVDGKVPELWWPETGRIERAAAYTSKGGHTSVILPLGKDGSVFVVFRKEDRQADRVVSIKRNSKTTVAIGGKRRADILVTKATYGVPGDAGRTRDVLGKVKTMLDRGQYSFPVAAMAEGDDPAFGVVKTLNLTYSSDGEQFQFQGTDGGMVALVCPSDPFELRTIGNKVKLIAWKDGSYELTRESGKTSAYNVSLPAPLEINNNWQVSFPKGSGAPANVEMKKLVSLSEHPDQGVKSFSGTATYRTTFDVPEGLLAKKRPLKLDLGDVEVMARVKLNGKDMGLLWRPPYSIAVNGALKAGLNQLEIEVTNLWPNRMIGDEQLPEDSDRHDNGTLRSWPQWVTEGKSSPTGRIAFESWRLWGKDDALLRSGLIGPVRLRAAQEIAVR